MIRSNLRTAAGLLIVLATLASGCQWLSDSITQSDRVAERHRQRTEAVARNLDQQHEEADLIAARDLWQRGDHEGCKRRLNELLTRNPEQLDARLLLAEVLLDENQPQEGIRVLKPAEAAHHDDARVQYTMGLLLDAAGSQAGARSHYQAAARLEPGNEVYTVSYNEAIASAKGIAPAGTGENKDLKQCDPSVPPPPPSDAQRSALKVPQTESGRAGAEVRGSPAPVTQASGVPGASSGSAVSTVGQANRGTSNAQADRPPAPGSTPQEAQLPVILRGSAPLPAVGADPSGPKIVQQNPPAAPPAAASENRPGPQIILQNFSGPPRIAPLPQITSAPATPSAAATPSAPIQVAAPEPDNLSESAVPPTNVPSVVANAAPIAALAPSTAYSVSRPELPMPMRLKLSALPAPAGADKAAATAATGHDVSILAASLALSGPTAAAAPAPPNALPLETTGAKKLRPDSAPPSLRFVDPAEKSGAVEISDGFTEPAAVDCTAHTEPINPAESARAKDGLRDAVPQTANPAASGTSAPSHPDLSVQPQRAKSSLPTQESPATVHKPPVVLVAEKPPTVPVAEKLPAAPVAEKPPAAPVAEKLPAAPVAEKPPAAPVAEKLPAVPALLSPRDSIIAGKSDRTAHAEPIDAAQKAAAADLLRQGAETLSAGKTDVAMVLFREAAASRPDDPQIPISASVAALRQNHPEVAVDLLQAAAGRFPKSAAVYRTLGAACYRRTDYRAAQSALKQALLLDKANPLSYFLLGCTLVKLGEQPAADECFRQARLLDPKYAVPRQQGQMP